jgi:hypothetical protein
MKPFCTNGPLNRQSHEMFDLWFFRQTIGQWQYFKFAKIFANMLHSAGSTFVYKYLCKFKMKYENIRVQGLCVVDWLKTTDVENVSLMSKYKFLKCILKRQSHEIFYLWFFHKSANSKQNLKIFQGIYQGPRGSWFRKKTEVENLVRLSL